MAENPYSFMNIDEEDDPWRAYQPWQVSQPSIPTYPTQPEYPDMGYGSQPDYTIPGNVDAAGSPTVYPGGWGAGPRPDGSAGASPFWSLSLPSLRSATPTVSPGRAAFTRPGSSTVTSTTTGAGGAVTNDKNQATTTPQEWEYWGRDDQALKGLQTWASVMLPYTQAQQNAFQWGAEFDEASRRYNVDTQWRQQLEQYNADLSTRQQQMAELQARDVSGQWRQEFARQAGNDAFAQQLALDELALAEERMGRELTIAERDQVWKETYQQAQIELEREQIAAQLEAARYASFGRGQSPARFVANWG